MKRIAENLILILCAVLFCISSFKIYSYVHQNRVGAKNAEELRSLAVQAASEESTQVHASGAAEETEETMPREKAPISVDFAALKSTGKDIVGWLYCPDTLINYPLAQSSNNSYYLDHLTDGSYNALGTIFLDYRCSSDFSDHYNVIYGHSMNNGTMFGTLDEYKTQSYYDAHPQLYLLMPELACRIDLVAGVVVSGNSEIYTLPKTEEEADQIISEAITNSTFSANLKYDRGQNYIILSTCSNEFDEARYILIGAMTEILP